MADALDDAVYSVVEATNDDGTIDGEVQRVSKEDDKIVVEVLPLVPDAPVHTYRFDFPTIHDYSYEIVCICREYVGSFEYLPQLEGEIVQLEQMDDSDEFMLSYDGQESGTSQYLRPLQSLLFTAIGFIGFTVLPTVFFVAGVGGILVGGGTLLYIWFSFVLAPFFGTPFGLGEVISLTIGIGALIFVCIGIASTMVELTTDMDE